MQNRRRDNPSALLLQKAQARAKAKGLLFDISLEDIETVWPEDNRCPVLGIELRKNKGVSGDSSPTLDRMRPEYGYIVGNIAVISHKANRLKSDLTVAQLELLAAWMRRNELA